MEIQARAKINWTLNVTGKREDGYHLLDMLMQPIALHDTLYIEAADGLTLTVECADGLSAGDDNLVLRAARALQAIGGISRGASMRLIKRIPMGAGLGGGSADAAAALKGLNKLWGIGLDLPALCRIGERLGADIPFCLHDAPRRAQGIGENLTPIESGPVHQGSVHGLSRFRRNRSGRYGKGPESPGSGRPERPARLRGQRAGKRLHSPAAPDRGGQRSPVPVRRGLRADDRLRLRGLRRV